MNNIEELAEKMKSGEINIHETSCCATSPEAPLVRAFVDKWICTPEGRAEIMKVAEELRSEDAKEKARVEREVMQRNHEMQQEANKRMGEWYKQQYYLQN